MKFGDILCGTITRFDHKGRGVFDTTKGDGGTRAVLVPFTTIGDTVEAKFIKRQEGCFVCDLARIVSPGPSRRLSPLSPDLPQNPSMLWGDIQYDDQLAFKRMMINEALEQAGHDERVETVEYQGAGRRALGAGDESPFALADSSFGGTKSMSQSKENPTPLQPDTPTTLYYRNRMDYAVGWKGEIGLKEYGSWNRYIDLKNCLLLSPDAPAILEAVREFMKRFPALKPWDAKKQTGDLRYVVIREGKNTGDRLLALVVHDLARITDDARKTLVELLDGFANNIVLAENPALTDLSFGRTIVPLKGKETFEEIINGTRYTIQLNSFFQTNSVMAAKLQDVVAEMVRQGADRRALGAGDESISQSKENPTTRQPNNPSPSLLDLYCGLGFFGINLAMRDPNLHVNGYEIYEPMIKLARANAEQNGVGDRCTFESGKAEDLSWKDIPADIVIVDPPRAGLHRKVIETLLEKNPQTIIYVSCDYHHLVEELKRFKEQYRITDLKALDLFPHTPHVEVVVRMEREKA